jgi:hypothetical protein
LSSHEQSDFPPLYDPPPKPYFGVEFSLLEIVEIIADQPTADWVRATYMEKFGRSLHRAYGFDEPHWKRVAIVLGRLPEGSALIEELKKDEMGYEYGLKRHLELNSHIEKKATEHKAAPPN